MGISWICPYVCIEVHSFSFCVVSTVFFLLVFVLGGNAKVQKWCTDFSSESVTTVLI